MTTHQGFTLQIGQIMKSFSSCAATLLLGLALCATTPAAVAAAVNHAQVDGVYGRAAHAVYVGVEGEPAAHPSLQYFAAATGRIGTLVHVKGEAYRSAEAPYLQIELGRPTVAVIEERHLVRDGLGDFGFSLWHARGAVHRPLIVLLEGADDSTRQMGFLIPYFVAHGMAVLTYDQRGTGVSSGNWRYASPSEKAADVVAALGAIEASPAIDRARTGVWAPSNGGWVAPLLARRLHLAFMILKSADSEPITTNVLYEVRQDLERGNHYSSGQVRQALGLEARLFRCLQTNRGWSGVDGPLRRAEAQPWFPLLRIPPGFTVPPPPPVLAAYRAALIYDPGADLRRITVPTLALFGALDRNVDPVAAARGFRRAFARAGMKDFTEHVFPGADHLLMDSRSGYEGDESTPGRFVRGYPRIMIDWLRARGLAL